VAAAPPLGGLLHRELLGLTGTAKQYNGDDKTHDPIQAGMHSPFLSSSSRELIVWFFVL
jgi:hypothetical protein